jgi:hypothetical protein
MGTPSTSSRQVSNDAVTKYENPVFRSRYHNTQYESRFKLLFLFSGTKFLLQNRPSINKISNLSEIGGVAKWSKATVCKTVIRGFESHRRLSGFYWAVWNVSIVSEWAGKRVCHSLLFWSSSIVSFLI